MKNKDARYYMGHIIGSASGGFPHNQATGVITEAMEQEYRRGYEEGKLLIQLKLEEALEALEEAIGYCPGYFVEKWGFDKPLAKFVPSYDGTCDHLRKAKYEGNNK